MKFIKFLFFLLLPAMIFSQNQNATQCPTLMLLDTVVVSAQRDIYFNSANSIQDRIINARHVDWDCKVEMFAGAASGATLAIDVFGLKIKRLTGVRGIETVAIDSARIGHVVVPASGEKWATIPVFKAFDKQNIDGLRIVFSQTGSDSISVYHNLSVSERQF